LWSNFQINEDKIPCLGWDRTHALLFTRRGYSSNEDVLTEKLYPYVNLVVYYYILLLQLLLFFITDPPGVDPVTTWVPVAPEPRPNIAADVTVGREKDEVVATKVTNITWTFIFVIHDV
jgi:hypothetical protein